MTRCKFKCDSVTYYASGSIAITMSPVTSGSTENAQFFKYTPSGNLQLDVVSEETAKQFHPGKEYYLDITEA